MPDHIAYSCLTACPNCMSSCIAQPHVWPTIQPTPPVLPHGPNRISNCISQVATRQWNRPSSAKQLPDVPPLVHVRPTSAVSTNHSDADTQPQINAIPTYPPAQHARLVGPACLGPLSHVPGWVDAQARAHPRINKPTPHARTHTPMQTCTRGGAHRRSSER